MGARSPVECEAWYQLEEGHEPCVLFHKGGQQQRTQQASSQHVHVAKGLGAGQGLEDVAHLSRRWELSLSLQRPGGEVWAG